MRIRITISESAENPNFSRILMRNAIAALNTNVAGSQPRRVNQDRGNAVAAVHAMCWDLR